MFARRTGWNAVTNPYTKALERQRSAGTRLLDLTASNPTECGFQYEEEKIRAALAKPQALRYTPMPQGLQKAREAVGQYYAELPIPVTVPPESLLLTTSTSEAYTYIFRLLCDAGDEVLIPQPSYPLFDLLAAIQDVKLIPYPLLYDHGWHMDLHAIESAMTERTRAVIVVHPNNPTGSFASESEARALADIAGPKQLAVIADEVFLDYTHGAPARSFAAQRDALTFTLSGLSKIAGLPQMKIAWMAVSGPEQFSTQAIQRLEIIADTYLSMNAPVQHAVPELLETRRGFQSQLQARLRRNLIELDRQLSMQQTCSRLAVAGGWYATLRVPVTRSDEELAIELMERAHVLVQPGHFFDFSGDGYLVVSLMTPEDEFTEGINRLLAFVR